MVADTPKDNLLRSFRSMTHQYHLAGNGVLVAISEATLRISYAANNGKTRCTLVYKPTSRDWDYIEAVVRKLREEGLSVVTIESWWFGKRINVIVDWSN